MVGTRGQISRRALGAGLGALGALALARPALAGAAPRVVIIGGGAGGATVAGGLKLADPGLDVTLVEPNKTYASCFFSNHFIGGFLPFERLTHNYDGLGAAGVKLAYERAVGVDHAARTVRLAGGSDVPFDVLVVAPGIDLKLGSIEGLDETALEVFPHAWRGGAQTQLLRQQLEAMEDGGLVVITAPRNPYRCPPGPYERACVIASYLKATKPKSKLIILDAKMAFSKQAVFEEAYAKYYEGVLEHRLTNDIDDMGVARVDPKTREVMTKSGERFSAAVANVVPEQRAGEIARVAGLVDGDWCSVDPATFRSTKVEGVYVLGDAANAQEMPKSAFSAHNQAKVVIGNILADLGSSAGRPSGRFRNTCWSMLAMGDSVKIGADYAPGEMNGRRVLVPSGSFISAVGETAAVRKAAYEESLAWHATLVGEVFLEHEKSLSGGGAGSGG